MFCWLPASRATDNCTKKWQLSASLGYTWLNSSHSKKHIPSLIMKITSLWNMTIEIIVKSSNWAHVRPMTSIATLQAPREPCQSHGTVRTARCWWTPARTASRRNRIRIQNWIVAIWWVKTFKTLYLYLCIYIYTITQYIYNIYIVYVYMYSVYI